MEITFEVKVEVQDLRNYMFCHKYKSVSGVIEILLGVFSLIFGIVRYGSVGEKWQPYMLILIFFGIFFLVISPLKTYGNAARQYMALPMYKEPFLYVLNDEGITVKQGGEEASLPWGQVYRVKDNGKSIILYITRLSANVLPKRCFADKLDEVKDMFVKNLDAKRVKF